MPLLKRAVFIGLVISSGGCQDSSRPFESKQAGFSIQFADRPRTETQNSSIPEFSEELIFEGKTPGKLNAAVSASSATDQFIVELEKRGLAAALEYQKRNFFSKPNTKYYSAKDLALPGTEIRGYEVTTTSDDRLYVRMRTFLTPRRLYQLGVMGSRAEVESQSATEFLDSFRLLGKS